jgi:hypothetical protein
MMVKNPITKYVPTDIIVTRSDSYCEGYAIGQMIVDRIRADAGRKPKCGAGSKVCGSRCIPSEHECHVGQRKSKKQSKTIAKAVKEVVSEVAEQNKPPRRKDSPFVDEPYELSAPTDEEREKYLQSGQPTQLLDRLKDDLWQLPPDMPPEEVAAIAEYTTVVGRDDMDGSLLGKRSSAGEQFNQDMQSRYKLLNAGISKMLPFKGTAYESKKMKPSEIAEYEPGKTVHHKGVTSASKSRQKGLAISNVDFEILSKHGADVSSISLNKPAQEVLFRPGSSFKVLEKRTEGEGFSQHTYIKLEDVSTPSRLEGAGQVKSMSDYMAIGEKALGKRLIDRAKSIPPDTSEDPEYVKLRAEYRKIRDSDDQQKIDVVIEKITARRQKLEDVQQQRESAIAEYGAQLLKKIKGTAADRKNAVALSKEIKIDSGKIDASLASPDSSMLASEYVQGSLIEVLAMSKGKGARTLGAITGGVRTPDIDVSHAIEPSFGETGLIHLVDSRQSESGLKESLFHEVGHHVEFSDPNIKQAAREYRESKITSPEIKKIRYFEGYEGDFLTDYMGRVYVGGSTEIISVGVEHLSNPQLAASMMLKDPEFFKFIVGVLKS